MCGQEGELFTVTAEYLISAFLLIVTKIHIFLQ